MAKQKETAKGKGVVKAGEQDLAAWLKQFGLLAVAFHTAQSEAAEQRRVREATDTYLARKEERAKEIMAEMCTLMQERCGPELVEALKAHGGLSAAKQQQQAEQDVDLDNVRYTIPEEDSGINLNEGFE